MSGYEVSPFLSQPTSHEEILRQAVDAFNRRDREAWLALCDPQLENIPPRGWLESFPVKGREAAWDFYVQGSEPWVDSPLSLVEVADADEERVVAHIQGEMRGRLSGAEVRWSFWQVVTFRNAKLVRAEWFAERDEAIWRFRDSEHAPRTAGVWPSGPASGRQEAPEQ